VSPAASKPRAKRGEGPKTTYVILSALGNMAVPLFKAVDDVEATSSSTAIREHMRRSGGTENWKSIEPVLFVAVPKRSWQVIKAQVERTERLIVGPWKPNGTAAEMNTPLGSGLHGTARIEASTLAATVPGPTSEMSALLSSGELTTTHANVEDDIPF